MIMHHHRCEHASMTGWAHLATAALAALHMGLRLALASRLCTSHTQQGSVSLRLLDQGSGIRDQGRGHVCGMCVACVACVEMTREGWSKMHHSRCSTSWSMKHHSCLYSTMSVASHFNTRHTCHTHALAALLAIYEGN